jgi:uncharacterized membrane protein
MANAVTEMYDTAFGGEKNLSFTERGASVVFGLVLAAAGLNVKGAAGALMGIAGGALALRGASGHCPIKAAIEGNDSHRQIAYQH